MNTKPPIPIDTFTRRELFEFASIVNVAIKFETPPASREDIIASYELNGEQHGFVASFTDNRHYDPVEFILSQLLFHWSHNVSESPVALSGLGSLRGKAEVLVARIKSRCEAITSEQDRGKNNG